MKNKLSTPPKTDVATDDIAATEATANPDGTSLQPASTDSDATDATAAAPPEMLTMSADDLSRLLTQAEERGYRRASAPAEAEPVQPGLYEEPDALGQQPAGWKASPLLSSRRPSIWDR